MLEAVRVSNRHDDLTRSQGRRVGEPDPRQRACAVRRHAEDGQIVVGILADQLGAAGDTVDLRHPDSLAAADDVTVRDDEPVGREQEAGPAAARVDVDLHDGGACPLDRVDNRAGIAV